jgi:lipopolysaccharide export system protein LptC
VQMQGGRGLVSSNGENVYFMDNVKVIRAATQSRGELTVLTAYLHIIPDQDFAQTDRPVTILQAPRTVIHANGMEFYKKERVLKLFNRVKAHYERPGTPSAPPLTAGQLIDKPVKAVRSDKVRSGEAVLAKPDAGAMKSNGKKDRIATVGSPGSRLVAAGNTEIKTGRSKRRIRRHYANTAD